MAEDKRDSFIRWQSTTIEQLTYAVNLILSFSVATLGFQVTILLDEKFKPSHWQKPVFSVSLVILLISVGLGIWCVINRLRDFRATTRVARMREGGKSDAEMAADRALSDSLGKITWKLFWWQIGTFGVGVLFLVAGIAGSVSEKLY
jgi:hypothetical protein